MKRPEARCDACAMRKTLCVCAEAARCRASLKIRTRVVILMHYREAKKTTNTGRLAHLALPGCEIRQRGLELAPMDSSGILSDDRRALLLYPADDAQELSPAFVALDSRPVTLIVPDGNWRQASKVPTREKFLKDVPRVVLPRDADTEYKLRVETKDGGLATFEAIARALGHLEGPEVRHQLESLFRLLVARTLRSRVGILEPEEAK
jgi:DTW domain-containing protein YfiP